MLPCLPIAPKRGSTPLFLQQALNASHQNWEPLSEIRCLGFTLAHRRPRKVRTWMDVGCLNTMTPIARREKWSMTTATHQQNGQICGKASGVNAVHMPSDVGITVKKRLIVLKATALTVGR